MFRHTATILALSLIAGCGDDGGGDPCGDVECIGCVRTAEVTVMAPGAPDGSTVSAPSLSCTSVVDELSTCQGPYPGGEDGTTTEVSAPGFETASVRLTLMRDPDPPTGCCACPDDRLVGSVTLTPSMLDGAVDGSDDGGTDGGTDADAGDAASSDA